MSYSDESQFKNQQADRDELVEDPMAGSLEETFVAVEAAPGTDDTTSLTDSHTSKASRQEALRGWKGVYEYIAKTYHQWLQLKQSPSSQVCTAVPLSIATAIDELKRSPAKIISACGFYTLISTSMVIADKYIVSGSDWNLYFSSMTVMSVIHIAGKTIGSVTGLSERLSCLNLEKAKLYLPLSLIWMLQEYSYLRALRFLSIPTRSIFKAFSSSLLVVGLGVPDADGVFGLSFGLVMLSCLQAGVADISKACFDTINEFHGGNASGVTLVAAFKPALITLASSYAWILLNTACKALISLISYSSLMDKANIKDAAFYMVLLAIPFQVICSTLFEDLAQSNIDKNFPVESRNMLVIAIFYSAIVSILLSRYLAWCRQVIGWSTQAMIESFDIIPVTLGSLIFSNSGSFAFGSLYAALLGLFGGMSVPVYCFWQVYSGAINWPPKGLILMFNILSLMILFSSPALFGGFHHAIFSRIYPNPDGIITNMVCLMIGLAVSIRFCLSHSIQNVSRQTVNMSRILNFVSLFAIVFSAPKLYLGVFSCLRALYAAGLCTIGSLIFVFYQIDLNARNSLPTTKQ